MLIYDRLYKLLAKSYAIRRERGQKVITYIDYIDGRRYRFPMRHTGPFTIYSVEISSKNVLREVWEQTTKRGQE